MRTPRGLTVTYGGVENGRVYFKVRATKFYLFKVILKIASQNTAKPHIACLIVIYALYYLVK